MSSLLDIEKQAPHAAPAAVSAPFFARGALIEGEDAVHRSRDLGVDFATPRIDLDRIVHPRTEVPPLLNVPLAEIIDFLVETGRRISDPNNRFVRDCIDRMCATHVLPRAVLEHQVRVAAAYLDKRLLHTVVEQNFPDPRALDEWVARRDYTGRRSFVRAFAPRLVHVLPGNSPGVAVKSIAQGALVKAINLFKMSSSDPFTTVAILRTMADIDAGHAIVRSMSAVYWRGGDAAVERVLYRPQYFDKIVAWGGGEAIDNVVKYLGPGLQLVSFDPKTSISMVGREAFASEQSLELAADLASADVMVLNQEACVASRFLYVEGTRSEVDGFCERLQRRIAERAQACGDARPLDLDLREQIETLMMMDDDYRIWGKTDGRGCVIRSEEPVEFHPINKTANVVCVPSLDEAVRHVNVATQTVGFYPFDRMADYRDRLASGGAQRIVHLGEAGPSTIGNPHDAMYPLHRFVHWMAHEDGCDEKPRPAGEGQTRSDR
ncbi:MAG TPA: acyl-CoA reductase [Steroidobacteraceae bacterium]|nr:acyl-CoA reductase [Steroidobacteraceae bacterium]